MTEQKMYVGNLSYSVTDDDLKKLFSEYGEVKAANVITDRDTGRSKGFGFVEMSDVSAIKKAIDALDGKEHDGRALKVNEARPKPQGGRDGNRGGGGGYRQRY